MTSAGEPVSVAHPVDLSIEEVESSSDWHLAQINRISETTKFLRSTGKASGKHAGATHANNDSRTDIVSQENILLTDCP